MLLHNKIMEALIPPMIWLTTFLENLNRGLDALKPGPIGKVNRRAGRVLFGSEYLPSADLEAMAKALYGLLGPPTKFTTLSPKNTAESVW